MIYVVRHGETDWNREGRLQGRDGRSLNSRGLVQAKELNSVLASIKFDYVYSSPQERAVQTAEIAAGVTPVIDERLNVFDLGEADGLRKEEVKVKGMLPDRTVYKGVEEEESFIARVFEFLSELEDAVSGKDLNILISCHRCTTGGIGAYFHGIPENRNILEYSSDNGNYKTYSFPSAETKEKESDNELRQCY
ncbi:histidine phosphatase family protein [Rossellomorea vietnamensis]|uniref:Histidine phosphatase family protein n=1 Tax=Rossellomorea vietnamensis TaxID=218284 RepID=A0A5D4MHY5_9BACI|nr:histidine phosphatase family protein [Rossellomorea vietnamensis]TYS01450.1 histidine phosphatase family protein [Rossellomorea vietnamensis]